MEDTQQCSLDSTCAYIFIHIKARIILPPPPTPWRTYQIIDHLFHQGNIQNLFISKFYLFITYSFFFSLSLVCVVVWGVQQRIIFRNHFSPSAMYISGIKFSSPCLAEYLYSLSHLDNPRTHVSNKFSHALCAAAGQGHLDWEATVRSAVCQNCPLGVFQGVL